MRQWSSNDCGSVVDSEGSGKWKCECECIYKTVYRCVNVIVMSIKTGIGVSMETRWLMEFDSVFAS